MYSTSDPPVILIPLVAKVYARKVNPAPANHSQRPRSSFALATTFSSPCAGLDPPPVQDWTHGGSSEKSVLANEGGVGGATFVTEAQPSGYRTFSTRSWCLTRDGKSERR